MSEAPIAVVLAGGVGRRLHPYTLTVPKPMMPIGERPILEILVDRLRAAGLRRYVFAIGHLGEIIRAHFGDGRAFGVSIHYSAETEPLGTAGPLDLVRPLLDRAFLLVNGDILADFDWAAIIARGPRGNARCTVSRAVAAKVAAVR